MTRKRSCSQRHSVLNKPGDSDKAAVGLKPASKIGAGKLGLKRPAKTASHDEPSSGAPDSSRQPEAEKPLEPTKTAPKQTQPQEVTEEDEKVLQHEARQEASAETAKAQESPAESVQPAQEEQVVQKKVFRKPGGESDHSAAAGTSNLKMLQQCKLELAKKESLVAKMSDELKELCKSHPHL